MSEDENACDHEDQAERDEGVALEGVDQVVAHDGDQDLDQHDESEREGPRPTEEGGKGEGAGDRVDDEPADGGGEGVEAAGQQVAPIAEGGARLDHLRGALGGATH